MAGISDKALKKQYVENKYRYNDGSELANKEFSDGSGLEMYETPYRGYDPQVGRFWQIDAIGEALPDWSPYGYALDNPIFFNDPLGLLSDSLHPQELAPATVTPSKGIHLANTRGSSPHVTAGPAPTTVAAPITAGAEPLPLNPLTPVGPPGKVIPLEPAPGLIPTPGLVGTGLMTIGATLSPLSMGPEGIPEPNPLFSPRMPDSKPNDDGSVILYRGVFAGHPAFDLALQGIAMPWDPVNGHSDPIQHNKGGGLNTKSIYTSWTTRPVVAVRSAGRYGVVLVKRFNASQLVASPDVHDEQEVLVPGIVTGAAVFSAWTTRKL